jgi:hypothetical protein
MSSHLNTLLLEATLQYHQHHSPLPPDKQLDLEIEHSQAQIREVEEKVRVLRQDAKIVEIEVERLKHMKKRPRIEITEKKEEEGRKRVKRVLDSISGADKARLNVDGEEREVVDEGTRTVLEAVEDLTSIRIRMRTEVESVEGREMQRQRGGNR